MDAKSLHIAMYPWLAIGHITPFFHIANKLAERGHKISFFIPKNTQSKVQHLNLHPHLISFIPITLPHVDGLPLGTETTKGLPYPQHTLLITAMNLTQPAIEACLRDLKPHFIFYDFACWIPSLARGLGIKPLHYYTVSPATVGYCLSPERESNDEPFSEFDLINPPPGFPKSSSIRMRPHEARGIANGLKMESGKGVSFMARQRMSLVNSDAIVFKTCREMEGPYCDYIETQLKRQVLLAGPVLPEPPISSLKEKWVNWLGDFKPKSVVFCALGTECVLSKDMFQELVLGLELTGMPFLAALKPPVGTKTIESALPEGFKERTEGRGVVHGGFVQQQLILNHPSVGAFVTHCGLGSFTEGMVSECQLVLLPYRGDQFINARLMGGDLKVGIEIERDEQDGKFTKEGVCKAVRDAMEEGSEVGQEIRSNHSKWRKFLCSEGLENSYIDALDQKLHDMLHS